MRGVGLDEDYHVHTTLSDDAVSTVADNVRAARDRGLRTLCLADHVRRNSADTAHRLADAVTSERSKRGPRLIAAVETKILDTSGHLDLPPELPGVELVLVADHRFPGPSGPLDPGQVRSALASGALTAGEAFEALAEATAAALSQARPALLAHLFSVLPKAGLAEADVPRSLLAHLAREAARAGAMVEVNEKWGCPSARSLRAFAAAGVPIVASTDSHDCAEVGVYRRVPAILGGAAIPARTGPPGGAG